ncbi:hypothetical protein B0H13DRAFT_2660217, partial [Mycena leptocephala]
MLTSWKEDLAELFFNFADAAATFIPTTLLSPKSLLLPMTEYDYSPEAFALHAARLYGWSDYYRQPDWLSVDPTNRNAVRGIEPATGPPDSELSAMTDLRRSERSHSLLTLLKIIYWDYAAGHPDALFRVSQRVPREEARPHFGITRGLNKETASRLKQIFRCYEVPFSERPLSSSTARERICVARKAGIIRICEACYRLGANIDVGGLVRQDLALTHEIGNLNARCQRLEYLFRTGRACPRNRARVEKLIESIKMSSALNDIELLRNRESFSDLYFKFCELTLMGEDT